MTALVNLATRLLGRDAVESASFASRLPSRQDIIPALGWFLTAAVPFSLFFFLDSIGVDENSAIFVAIVSLPLVMWPFELLDRFVPGIIAIALILLVGAAPADVVLSGFASSGFLLIIAILGLGALIRTSGLINRLAETMILRLPSNVLAYAGATFLIGLLSTPFLPSPAGRTSVFAPLVKRIEGRIGDYLTPRGRTLVYLAGVEGPTLLTASFLTAAPVNMLIFSLLPQQERFAFQFTDWMIGAAMASVVLVVGFVLLCCLLVFDATPVEVKSTRAETERVDGLLTREWGAVGGILCLAIGVLTTPMHLIPAATLAFLILTFLFASNVLGRNDFVHEIDWSFIFLLGTLVGLTNTAAYLGLTEMLIGNFVVLGETLHDQFEVFVLILAGVMVAIRLIVPQTATTLIMVAALLPIAEASGVTAWIVGFIILVFTDAIIFDYQSPMHANYHLVVDWSDRVLNRRIIILRVAMIGVRVAAVFASIAYWQWMGML